MSFCYYKDENEDDKEEYPKWSFLNLFISFFKKPSYVQAFKDGFVIFHRDRIIYQANINKIPPELLAGVAWSEVGGKPDYFKPFVMAGRMIAWNRLSEISNVNLFSIHRPEKTSLGAIAMQIETAAKTLDPSSKPLSYIEQFELSSCLLHDTYNINLAARLLNKLILYDYPDCDTSHLTDEQFILAGCRYNRGIERKKQDFIDSIHADQSNVELRTYSSYGRHLLLHRPHIMQLLNLH